MAVELKGDWTLIGLGGCGTAAVAYLEQRRADGLGRLPLLKLPGEVPGRRQGPERFAEAVAGGALSAVLPTPFVAIIAAADEAVGGGMLPAAVQWLRERGGAPPVAWLALPAATADRGGRARACATLLEVAWLLETGALSCCFLHEPRRDGADLAPVLADAALAHACLGTPGKGFRGFGLGVICDPAASLIDALCVPYAAAALERFRNQPDSGRAGDGLRRVLGPLLVDVQEPTREIRPWFARESVYYRQQTLTRSRAADLLRPLWSRNANHYDDVHQDWRDRMTRYWNRAGEKVEGALRLYLSEQVQRSDPEAAYAEACQAVDTFRAELERQIVRMRAVTNQKRGEWLGRAEALKVELHRHTLPKLDTASAGRDLLDEFEHTDALHAGWQSEALRLRRLEALAADLDAVVEGALSSLRQQSEWAAAVRSSLQAPQAAAKEPLPRHWLSPRFTPELENQLLAAGPMRTFSVLRQRPAAAEPEGRMADLLKAASQDLASEVRPESLRYGQSPNPGRESWLAAATAGPAFVAPPPAGLRLPRRQVWTVDRGLLGVQGAEVARLAPQPFPGHWFPDEGLVYMETEAFEPGLLASLGEFQDAYAAATGAARANLHALPQPGAGWPSLAPRTAAPQPQWQGAARTAVRSSLLGLVSDTGEGGAWVARFVAPDGSIAEVPVGEGPAGALRLLAADSKLQAHLDRLAQNWLAGLEPGALAGYLALLRWTTRQVGDPARLGGDPEASQALMAACTEEIMAITRELTARGDTWVRLGQALSRAAGTPADDFSVGTRAWRYLSW